MNFQMYPFEKLNALLSNVTPNSTKNPIVLTIGEPQFETPSFILDALKDNAHLLNKYPNSTGETILREAIKNFIKKRFSVAVTLEELIPTFGTREVLFNFPQFVLHSKQKPKIAFTNPFYQIYEGAAIASKAEILHIDLLEENNFKPIIDPTTLKDVDIVILNFPNNPTTSVLTKEELGIWVTWALEYDFVLVNDECYSEIYLDDAPVSLLEASIAVGNRSFKNVVVVNSISKRSSAPGLRSGFIAGDKELLKAYMSYRTYIGCASPLPLQHAAAVAWNDEKHVVEARKRYKKSFELVKEILHLEPAQATFYVWVKVKDDTAFTKFLYETENVKVLPGSYLGRNTVGEGYVRLALVENEVKTKEALLRFKNALIAFHS